MKFLTLDSWSNKGNSFDKTFLLIQELQELQAQLNSKTLEYTELSTQKDEAARSHEERMIALNEQLQNKYETEKEILMNAHREEVMVLESKVEDVNVKLANVSTRCVKNN